MAGRSRPCKLLAQVGEEARDCVVWEFGATNRESCAMNLSHHPVRTALVTLAALTAILVAGYAWVSTSQRGVNQGTFQKNNQVSGVSGFELRYEGLRKGELPFFEPGYAIWANYPYFTLGGETYERAGVGGAIIRRHYVRPTRYLVTETIDGPGEFLEHPRKSTLAIIDKKTHKVIASQILQGDGWVGQRAAEFVRHVLVPDEPIGVGGVGAKRYPHIPADVEPIGVVAAPARPRSGCGPTVTLSSHPGNASTLDTPLWRFLPQGPIKDFACSNGYVLVLSGIFPNPLYLDILTKSGTYVFQTEVSYPVPIDYTALRLERVLLSSSSAEFDVLYLDARDLHGQPNGIPDRGVHIHMSIKK